MDISSIVVLEDTLDELATRRFLSEGNSRLDECVTVIRACMKLIATDAGNRDYAQKIHQALNELSKIARQNREFAIAARLRTVAYRLNSLQHSQDELIRTARSRP